MTQHLPSLPPPAARASTSSLTKRMAFDPFPGFGSFYPRLRTLSGHSLHPALAKKQVLAEMWHDTDLAGEKAWE